MSIAILMACHNRREMTVRCLSELMPQLRVGDRVFVVDDGSTDGTGDEVSRLFDRSMVRILKGDGTLYWAKGMETAWRAAIAEVDWDGYLWLNDDAELNADALGKLREKDDGESIVVGEFRDAEGKIVYGLREGGLFTGNFVYVPRNVFSKLGVICGEYAHAWADSDYAMQANRKGVRIVGCGVVGCCEGHPNRPALKGLNLPARWKSLFQPKGWNLHDLWLYRKRNWGVCAAVFSCVHLIFHVVKGEG